MNQELENQYLAYLEQAAGERGAVLSRNTKKLLDAHLDKFATEEDKDRELNRLLKQQFCPDAICVSSQPFITAIAKGDHQTFDAMFKAYPELLNPQTTAGQRALYAAAAKGLQHGDMHFLRAIDMQDHTLMDASILSPTNGQSTSIKQMITEQMRFSSPDSADFDRAESAKVVIGAIGREHRQESQIAGNFHANQHNMAQAIAAATEKREIISSTTGRTIVMQEGNVELANNASRNSSENEYGNAQAFLRRAGEYEQKKEQAKRLGNVYTEFPAGPDGEQILSKDDFDSARKHASQISLAYSHAKHAAEHMGPHEKYESPGVAAHQKAEGKISGALLVAMGNVNRHYSKADTVNAAKSLYDHWKGKATQRLTAEAANGNSVAVKELKTLNERGALPNVEFMAFSSQVQDPDLRMVAIHAEEAKNYLEKHPEWYAKQVAAQKQRTLYGGQSNFISEFTEGEWLLQKYSAYQQEVMQAYSQVFPQTYNSVLTNSSSSYLSNGNLNDIQVPAPPPNGPTGRPAPRTR